MQPEYAGCARAAKQCLHQTYCQRNMWLMAKQLGQPPILTRGNKQKKRGNATFATMGPGRRPQQHNVRHERPDVAAHWPLSMPHAR